MESFTAQLFEDVAPLQENASSPVFAKRTKIVFFDSDDEAEPNTDVAEGATTGNVPTERVKHVVQTVVEDYQLTTDPEDLVDEILLVEQSNVDAFFEDTTPTAVSEAPEGLMPLPTTMAAASLKFQVVDVAEDQDLRPPLRKPTRAPRVVTDVASSMSSRKRYRDDQEQEPADVATAEGVEDVAAPAVLRLVTSSEHEQQGEEADGEDVVFVKHTDGYKLTLDERDMQDSFGDEEAEEEKEESNKGTGAAGNAEGKAEEGDDDEEDGDFGDFDDEESSDDELDDTIVEAAVTAMIACCKDPDVCEQITCKKFVEIAEEQLKKKASGEISVEEFDVTMMSEVGRLQRQIRKWNRPPPSAPVIIDGVLMDF